MEQFSMVANVKRTPSRTPSFLRSPPDQSELETQQITDLKRKLRVQQEQLDSKVVQLQEVQEELEKHKEQVHRLHSEKRQLSKDAQKVRVYKDEVEVLRAKASEVEQLLNENKKLRNMVEDVDYLKKKVQDLKEQNLLVQESKQLLEEELSSVSLQQKQLTEKNEEIAKLKMQVDALQAAKDADLQQIQELIEANTRLEFQKKHGEEEIALLQRESEDLKGQLAVKNGEDLKSSMENEVSEAEISARMKLLRLEHDNQQLTKAMEESKLASNAIVALENKNKELQQQSQKLRKEIAEMQEELESEKAKSQELENDKAQLQNELQKLDVDSEQKLTGFKLREQEKFTTLEARFDAALNRSVSCSEDRISVLELRLEEANQTNQDLGHELDALRQENVQLKATANLTLRQRDISSGRDLSSGSLGHVSPTDSGSSGGCSDEISPSIERRSLDADHQDRVESPQLRHGRLSISEHSHHPYVVQVKEGLSPSEFVRLQERREVGYLQDKVLDLRGEVQ
jgi:chromosome segregation ATPase